MYSEPTAAVEFPFVRLVGSTVKRPIVWLLIENPHDDTKPPFRFPALIDTGADRSVVPHKLCKVLGHTFDAGHSPGQAGGIGKGRIRTFSHSARLTIFATPPTSKGPQPEDMVFFPLEMRLGFVEQDLPFALLGQSDFLRFFEYSQMRAEWKFTLRRI